MWSFFVVVSSNGDAKVGQAAAMLPRGRQGPLQVWRPQGPNPHSLNPAKGWGAAKLPVVQRGPMNVSLPSGWRPPVPRPPMAPRIGAVGVHNCTSQGANVPPKPGGAVKVFGVGGAARGVGRGDVPPSMGSPQSPAGKYRGQFGPNTPPTLNGGGSVGRAGRVTTSTCDSESSQPALHRLQMSLRMYAPSQRKTSLFSNQRNTVSKQCYIVSNGVARVATQMTSFRCRTCRAVQCALRFPLAPSPAPSSTVREDDDENQPPLCTR